ncbi:hypothetical protein PUV44_06735 [Xanthomonas arboricola pv. corylina]|nr:hypothetical protein PUV44_06735 [Xanthomonas arboricola pv. corylina]
MTLRKTAIYRRSGASIDQCRKKLDDEGKRCIDGRIPCRGA